MVTVALIPARAGSKGVADKNLAPLAGKPLIVWTVAAALRAEGIDRVVVSTDAERIAAVAREAGAEVPFLRPAALAADDTPMLDVVLHAIGELQHVDVDLLVLLQPTSPLRTSLHIEEALELLVESGADAVVSVVEVPHQFRPGSLMRVEDGRLVALDPDVPLLRQAKDIVYARNGPAVLAARTSAIEREGRLYVSDMRPYAMRPEDSVDVDDLADLALAEVLLAGRVVQP